MHYVEVTSCYIASRASCELSMPAANDNAQAIVFLGKSGAPFAVQIVRGFRSTILTLLLSKGKRRPIRCTVLNKAPFFL